MPGQQNGDTAFQEERSRRQERAQRILDAAAGLIQRWGYKKTTIDDIAKHAGVAKGTIYLHWKTREELFRALMLREELKLAEDIKQRIAHDPEGSTLHGMIKHATLATMKHPLWKAVLLRDTVMLGELARPQAGNAAYEEQVASFKVYFEFLRSQGLVRTDIGLREEVYMLSAISLGFLLVEPFLTDEFKLSDEEAAAMLAETIRCTFEPHHAATPGELEGASNAFNQYFDRMVDIMKEESQKEMGS